MKIVHLNTFSGGGAGIAAGRLHEGLLTQGIHSSFLSFGADETQKNRVNYYSTLNLRQKIYFRLADNLSLRKINALRAGSTARSLKFDSEIYTCPFAKFHTELHPLVKAADIIHLHWVSGLIDIPSFFRSIQKPVVWTLHDMNPFMGGFHYEEDKLRSYSLVKETEDRFFEVKQQAITSFKNNLTIVCPSAWLGKKAAETPVFSEHEIYTIPNGISVSGFSQNEKRNFKFEFNFPSDKTVFLFLADNISNKRKGIDLLMKAVTFLAEDSVLLITVGKTEKMSETDKEVRHFGTINDPFLLSKIIAAADAVIIPSREDNLPNVMLEAFACGTPVIAFPVGGLAEHVKNGENGCLAAEVSADALASAISTFISSKSEFNSEMIKKYAVDKFSLGKVANQYIEVYKNVLFHSMN